MTSVPFEKWHGLGNDFIVVVDAPADIDWASAAPALCARHFGVGADGILLLDRNPARMRVVNADGSRPEMCGNGLRCAASLLAAHAVAAAASAPVAIEIETDAGELTCRVSGTGDSSRFRVEVDAGIPSFRPADAHAVATPGGDGLCWLDAAPGRGLVASVGNPHWIFFGDYDADAPTTLGRPLEHDPRFARRTNVEFVTASGPGSWRVGVWERGAGATLACGTGATAVAAALVRTGRAGTDEPLELELPGGLLRARVDATGAVTLSGPAQRVYTGRLSV
ncbi:MAG: diaminopimelate epimerase [Myxococcales bacterium]|nr:diaminopimelate epimerase [Myxococcales bacterium]